MNTIRISGPTGVIRWGYRPAITLGAWTLADGILTGPITHRDPIASTQRPLMFCIPRPSGSFWKWPIEALEFAGSTLTATLGPQETAIHVPDSTPRRSPPSDFAR